MQLARISPHHPSPFRGFILLWILCGSARRSGKQRGSAGRLLALDTKYYLSTPSTARRSFVIQPLPCIAASKQKHSWQFASKGLSNCETLQFSLYNKIHLQKKIGAKNEKVLILVVSLMHCTPLPPVPQNFTLLSVEFVPTY